MTKAFTVGDRVRIAVMPPYVKTADSMPMLRPPDVVSLGEEGVVLEHRPANVWSVRFGRGTFLVDGDYLEVVERTGDLDAEDEPATEASE